jgi:8-oxo-dGTP pyrophosphatase MutT (NUDIX family)
MTAIQKVRRAYWFVARPRTFGVHAVAFDAEGRVVLVRHSYAKGWRIPGGGVKKGEPPDQAMLRELREEIGLGAWSAMRHICDFRHRPDFRNGHGSLFRLDGIAFSPRRSLEIEAIQAFDPNDLPPETTPLTRLMIAEALKEGEDAPSAPGIAEKENKV